MLLLMPCLLDHEISLSTNFILPSYNSHPTFIKLTHSHCNSLHCFTTSIHFTKFPTPPNLPPPCAGSGDTPVVTSATLDAELPSRSKSLFKSLLNLVVNCRSPNDPEDADLTYYCKGLPSDYTDAHVPCQDCNIKAAATRDDNNSKSDNKGGANHDAGRGNDSRMGYMRALGKSGSAS